MGCVGQAGEQAFHIGRNAVLASSLPTSVPAVTIDRQCGSSQQAIQFAAQAVMSGTQDVVIAAGVESMTRVPMGLPVTLPMENGIGTGPFSKRIQERFGVPMFSQFVGAEMIAEKYQFRREELDAFALESHRKAARRDRGRRLRRRDRAAQGRSTPRATSTLHTKDEGIRYDATLEGIGSVKLLKEGGRISAANASPDLRRRQRRHRRQRAGAEGARPHPARPDRQPDRDRRRSGHHARGGHPRHPPRARPLRHEHRRHRPLRGQRGLRPGPARLAPRNRRRPAPGSTSTAARSPWATRSAPPAPS